jgi:hypothetical protein
MPAEVHASSYRAKGVALATCSNWFNNFIIVSTLCFCDQPAHDLRLLSFGVYSRA